MTQRQSQRLAPIFVSASKSAAFLFCFLHKSNNNPFHKTLQRFGSALQTLQRLLYGSATSALQQHPFQQRKINRCQFAVAVKVTGLPVGYGSEHQQVFMQHHSICNSE